MHHFDLDNALHLVQQEIDDHSIWDQYVATQNDNLHVNELNGNGTHEVTNELSFDDFSLHGTQPEQHDNTDDGDFFDHTVDWLIAETPKFVVSVVVGEEIGELFDSDVAKFAGHCAAGKLYDFVIDDYKDQ